MAAASMVLLHSFVVVISAQIASANIVLECLSLIYCDGKTPVCGSNGTHCWYSDSDCERAKFNCLQFGHKDFQKVTLNYCKDFPQGGIYPCCVPKTCPNRNKPICGQTIMNTTIKKCKWFTSRCDMDNFNCDRERDFIEVNKELCDFKTDSDEQYCSHASATGGGLT